VEYAAFKCFKYTKRTNTCQLYNADSCCKAMAALHVTLSAGACTKIIMDGDKDAWTTDPSHSLVNIATKYCNDIRQSPPNSWIAGMTRYWKEISARTTCKTRPATLDQHNNICTRYWSCGVEEVSIIDNLNAAAKSLLGDLLGPPNLGG
jgi:hypothetical protein